MYMKINVVDNKQAWFFGFKTSRISLGKEVIRFLFLPTRFKNFFSGGRGSGRGSGHVKALIYKHKHCIFKRFSALTVHFGGQNGQFNNLIFNFLQRSLYLPQTCADKRRQIVTKKICACRAWGCLPRSAQGNACPTCPVKCELIVVARLFNRDGIFVFLFHRRVQLNPDSW